MIPLTFRTLFYISHFCLVCVASVIATPDRHLIGVRPERRSYYELSNEQQDFKCLSGTRTIPRQFVNDNYCDCPDSSDEPGTSACPDGQFYCQNEGYLQKLIPSGWVNDGQCDCCDGSDEYNSTTSRCDNTCGVLGEIYRQEQERYKEISDRGSAIRSQYKEQARLRREQNSQLLEQYKRELSEKENAIKKIEEEISADYGPHQVFFPLKGQCYNYKDREYTYSLCPFERAVQESVNGMQTELGHWAGWAGSSQDPYSRQKYEGGVQCWNGPARSTLVNIACGVEDKIVSVTEPSKCEYVYDFITPAACPDLDPPEADPSPVPSDQETSDQQQQKTSQSEPVAEVEDDQHHNTDSEEGETFDPSETHDEL